MRCKVRYRHCTMQAGSMASVGWHPHQNPACAAGSKARRSAAQTDRQAAAGVAVGNAWQAGVCVVVAGDRNGERLTPGRLLSFWHAERLVGTVVPWHRPDHVTEPAQHSLLPRTTLRLPSSVWHTALRSMSPGRCSRSRWWRTVGIVW